MPNKLIKSQPSTEPTEELDDRLVVPAEVAVLPVRDMVLFPQAALPLTIGRESSIQLVSLLRDGNLLAVVAQKDSLADSPQPEDLYGIGTLAAVHKVVRMPNQTLFVFVQGLHRIRISGYTQIKPFLKGRVEILKDTVPARTPELEAMQRSVLETFQNIVSNSPNLSQELSIVALNIEDPGQLADFIASSVGFLTTSERQELLECLDVARRLEIMNRFLIKERQLLGTTLQDSNRGAGPTDADPARILLARADEGDPKRTG